MLLATSLLISGWKTDFGRVFLKEKWFQVTQVTAHSPTGMHGLKLAFGDAELPAFAPR
jgi:hypothetical protein